MTTNALLVSDEHGVEKIIIIILIIAVWNMILILFLFFSLRKVNRRMHDLANAIFEVTAADIHEEYHCLKCATPLLEGAYFCYRCGATTEEARTVKTCNSCHTEMPQEAQYCPKCHRRMWMAGASSSIAPSETGPITRPNKVHA